MSSVMYHPRFLVEVENGISLLPQTVGLRLEMTQKMRASVLL